MTTSSSGEDEEGELACLDVSGVAGKHGGRGRPGVDGSIAGGSGGDGGPASRAQRGQDAGALDLRVSAADGVLSIAGVAQPPDRPGQPVQLRAAIGTRGAVTLRALGGRGGDGGHGGAGGDGAEGEAGDDATSLTSGGRGGDGGDGGSGGDGTPGANGGRGGQIVVRVDVDATHLLLLVEPSVAGGDGGARGRNGDGGAGGAGGRGGRSFTWRESETVTDSDGTSRTRTTFHSNPGGSDGDRGRPGGDGRGDVSPGVPGEDGSFAIVVEDPGGEERTYRARFALEFAHFTLAEVHPDGVFEPGELVRVVGVQVTNVGGMPMPRRAAVQLGVVADEWVTAASDELLAPPELAADASDQVPGELRFRLSERTATAPGEPLEESVALRLRAWIPEIRRSFARGFPDEVAPLGHMLVRWPVRLSPLEYLPSLAPGESTRVRFTITNLSSRPLGGDGRDGRRVRVRVRRAPECELGDEFAALWGEMIALSPTVGWLHEVDLLAPGETRAIEFDLTIRERAPAYHRFVGLVSLELSRHDDDDALRSIQVRGFEVRVARPFVPDHADVLVVVNHRTTHAALRAWEEQARRVMATIATWDVSYTGHLDLDRPLAGGRCLADHFAGKTMLILNNEFDGPCGPVRADALLDRAQLRRAGASGLDVTFVGAPIELRQALLPAPAHPSATDVTIVADDKQAMAQALAHTPRTVAGVEQTFWAPWREPSAAWLERRAHRLSRYLARVLPAQRHVVVHRFAPLLLEGGVLRRRWRIGTLETMRTLDAAASAVQHAQASDESVNDPEYIRSQAATTTLLAMFDFDEQLERLRWLLAVDGTRPDAVRELCGVMLADLVSELVVAVAGAGRGGPLAVAMPRLESLATRCGTVALDAAPATELIALGAGLQVVADAHLRWYHRLPVVRRQSHRARVRAHVRQAIQRMLTLVFGAPSLAAANRALAAKVDELRRVTVDRRFWATDRRRVAIEHGNAALAVPGLADDASVLDDPDARVVASADADASAAAERTQAATRRALDEAATARRQALLVTRKA